MTINDAKSLIKEKINKDYVLISPRSIEEVNLIYNYTTLELYENINDNTEKFVNNIILDLEKLSKNVIDAKKALNFNLVYEGSFEEVCSFEGSFTEFVMINKGKIVAIYKYVKDKRKNYFIDYKLSNEDLQYDFVYVSLDEMFKKFENANINFRIDESLEDVPSYFRDDTKTRIEVCLNKENILENNARKLVKIK